jgi:hypothetical protein
MLHEIRHTRQTNSSYNKRWFTCCEMDLFVWLREGVPVRFQLAYDKLNRGKSDQLEASPGVSSLPRRQR